MKKKGLVGQKVEMEVNKYRRDKRNIIFSTALYTCDNYTSPEQPKKISLPENIDPLD